MHTDVVRWSHLKVSVDDCERYTDAVDRVRNAVEQEIQAGDARLVACRIELTGQSEVHGPLLSSQHHLLAEARAAALAFGDDAAWIERVVVSTEPLLSPAALAAREDAFGDLHRMLDDASADRELLDQLKADIGELIRKLPPEVRSETEHAPLKAAIGNDYAGLIGHVRGYLNVRLTAGKD